MASLFVVGARPERLLAGGISEFVKGSAQELGTNPAPMHPALLAARLGEGGPRRRIAGPLWHSGSVGNRCRKRRPGAGCVLGDEGRFALGLAALAGDANLRWRSCMRMRKLVRRQTLRKQVSSCCSTNCAGRLSSTSASSRSTGERGRARIPRIMSAWPPSSLLVHFPGAI